MVGKRKRRGEEDIFEGSARTLDRTPRLDETNQILRMPHREVDAVEKHELGDACCDRPQEGLPKCSTTAGNFELSQSALKIKHPPELVAADWPDVEQMKSRKMEVRSLDQMHKPAIGVSRPVPVRPVHQFLQSRKFKWLQKVFRCVPVTACDEKNGKGFKCYHGKVGIPGSKTPIRESQCAGFQPHTQSQ
jgi:hypothetical protein